MKYLKIVKSVFLFLLFAAGFLVILQKSTNIVRLKTNGGIDMVHSFYSIEKNTIDVLVTGSSHAYFGYSSNPLWEDHGVTGYVLASPAQRPKYTYYLLKEALKYQKPKVIMYETFGMYYKNDDGNEGDLRKACDAMRLGSVKLEMVNDICKDMTFDEKMSYYFPIIKYHSRWSELDDWDFVSRELFLHGSRLTMETRQYPPNKKGHWEPVAPNKTSMEYLKKIAGLCKQYDIPLVLFATPVNTYKEKK